MNSTRKKNLFIILWIAIVLGGLLAAVASWAQESGRQGPPPEAYTACEGKNAGDAAQFTSPFGDVVTGVCRQAGDRLALKPDHGGGQGGSQGGKRRCGPPPEAYTACEGKNAGDAAQFTSPFGDVVTGVCENEKSRLVLRPDHHKGSRGAGRQGNSNE